MSKAYFAPLVTLPILIDQPGEYRTRCGETVTITETSKRHDFGCKGTYSCGVPDAWHRSGRLYVGVQSRHDIVGKAAVTSDDLAPGQVYRVHGQGMAITPQTIQVTVHWVGPNAVHYRVEGTPELRETSLDRFLEIVNRKA